MVTGDLFPWLNVGGFIVLGLSYVFVQWRYGQNKASVEVIETYKEQVGLLRAQVDKLTKEVGMMEGSLKEKDNQINTYLAILQDRNPETEDFMKNSNVIIAEARAFMKDMSLTMTKLKMDVEDLKK